MEDGPRGELAKKITEDHHNQGNKDREKAVHMGRKGQDEEQQLHRQQKTKPKTHKNANGFYGLSPEMQNGLGIVAGNDHIDLRDKRIMIRHIAKGGLQETAGIGLGKGIVPAGTLADHSRQLIQNNRASGTMLRCAFKNGFHIFPPILDR